MVIDYIFISRPCSKKKIYCTLLLCLVEANTSIPTNFNNRKSNMVVQATTDVALRWVMTLISVYFNCGLKQRFWLTHISRPAHLSNAWCLHVEKNVGERKLIIKKYLQVKNYIQNYLRTTERCLRTCENNDSKKK